MGAGRRPLFISGKWASAFGMDRQSLGVESIGDGTVAAEVAGEFDPRFLLSGFVGEFAAFLFGVLVDDMSGQLFNRSEDEEREQPLHTSDYHG